MSRLIIKPDIKEYWIDDDGYIAYGKGDDYETVRDINSDYQHHVQTLTKIIETFPELLEALKALLWQHDNNNGVLCGMALQDARAAIKKAGE